MRTNISYALFIALVVLCVWSLSPAHAYNNTSLEWRTLKTEHFEVHYHQGAEWTAQQVAMIAEEVHGPLIELYDYEPDLPVHFIIKDTDDYANGAAFFFDNKVELWATNLAFGYRGTTNWLRNVVTHEYGHIVSIQAAMKTSRRLPAIYFQMITFEEERRPDVLQGYPKDIISYPLLTVLYPPWFAEGVAQFQTPGTRYDCWDTHRDMILRSAVLEDKMLTYNEMGFFGKSSMKGEQVYDHGFGLVNYIAREYGPEAIRDITKALKKPLRLNMDGALEDVIGKKGKDLYKDWKAYLQDRYEIQTEDIRDNITEGRIIVDAGEKKGYMNFSPVFSPDGKKIAYQSNKGNDYAVTGLFLMDRDGKNGKSIKGAVSSRAAFTSDGTKVYYSKKHDVDKYASVVNDIFVYDFETKKEKELLKGSRIGDPDLSPDGSKLVGVKNGDGTHRLVVLDADGENEQQIYTAGMGTQFYNPQFSPDGTQILFGIFKEGTRDIAAISSDGSGFHYLVDTPNDERDARWSRDGKRILFSCDRTGIFNIYELDLETGVFEQRTNVLGGAFTPDESEDGAVAYSHYSGDGYGIGLIRSDAEPVETLDLSGFETRVVKPYDECAFLKSASLDVPGGAGVAVADAPMTDQALIADATVGGTGGPRFEGFGSYAAPGQVGDVADTTGISHLSSTGSKYGPLESSAYKSTYSSFQFYPRVVVWDGNVRFGLNLTSNEILDKQSLFAGGSLGTNGEYDGYIMYEIRNFYPTLFADFIVLRQLHDQTIIDEESITPTYYEYETQYSLWQADIGLKLELSELYSLLYYHEASLYWAHGEYNVHLEGDEYRDEEYYTSFKGGWKYFIGNEWYFTWKYRQLAAAVDSDINPRGGRQISFEYMRAYDKLFSSGEFEYGFKPVYTDNNFNRYTLDWREYIGLPYLRNSLRVRLYMSIIDRTVDDFFWTYAGGRDGIRGYTYYSIGGKKAVIGSLSYRFPIWRNMDKQFFNFYFRDLYGNVFFETGNAWSDAGFATEGYKNSVGGEFRLSLGSFYMFPTAVTWTSAYALDPVEIVLTGFGTIPVVIKQERGWSHYFTMAFAFDL